MVCCVTRSEVKVKVTRPWKFDIWPFSKCISSPIASPISMRADKWLLIVNDMSWLVICHYCWWFVCMWQNGTSNNVTQFSGSPGYLVRQPVRAGHLTTNADGVLYPLITSQISQSLQSVRQFSQSNQLIMQHSPCIRSCIAMHMCSNGTHWCLWQHSHTL